jgi:adenylate cyclase
MKRQRWLYLIPLLSTAVFIVFSAYDPSFIRERIEALTLDYRFHIRNLIKKPVVDNDIIIVAIDEDSLREFGRWQWSRTLQARLIKGILKDKPKVLAVDILYSEPEGKVADRALSEAVEEGQGRVILAGGFEVEEENQAKDRGRRAGEGEVPDYILNSAFMKVKANKPLKEKELKLPVAYRALPPINMIGENALIGHVYSQPDRDGKLRWEKLFVKYEDEYYPSIALQTAIIAYGKSIEDAELYIGRGVSFGDLFIETDIFGRALINYRGKELTYRYVSAKDVLNGSVAGGAFRDKIVLLGTSAIATYDTKITSFSANMPGVEKNATVVDNILHNGFLLEAKMPVNIFVILLSALPAGLLLPRMKAIRGAFLAAFFIVLYVLAVQAAFTYWRLWVNLTYPMTNMLVIFTSLTISKYFFEEKKARHLRSMFSSYVSPKIVKELLSNPEKARLGGERRAVTVLFSDIAGFTSLSEKMQPEEVVSMLNEYFKDMADVIFRWDGTLDKFVGDEIMAFWGAPAEQQNHAELALRCALDMSKTLDKLHGKWKSEGKPLLCCGMGLNSGDVLVGNIGSEGRKMDYTVIGDNVNTAARVEALTRKYNARILITENTLNELRPLFEDKLLGHIEFVDLEAVKVKGKEKEIRIFQVKDAEARSCIV